MAYSEAVSFSLRKWYLDCIAADGELAVAYCAELRWGALALSYASLLQLNGQGPRVRSTLRSCPEPERAGRRISWTAPALGLSGVWDACAPAFAADLCEGVRWECAQPRSQVELQLPDGRTLRGLGYAEVLTLTIPPWSLPIQELRWGRFAGEKHGAVWIEWQGPHPVNLVLVDGVRAGLPIDAVLRLSETEVLRSGRIGKTALSIIPNLEKLFPGRIVGLEETKWRSRGTLTLANLPAEKGWAIHEVVRWPP